MRYCLFIFISIFSLNTISPQKIEAIDLGLPSGVKWGNMNIGATSETDYGEYFAWGEVKTKKYFGFYTQYQHYEEIDEAGADTLIFHKYDIKSTDSTSLLPSTRLDFVDDVAYQRLGGGWRMPTEKEMQELLDMCVWTIRVVDGTKGFVVKSKVNSNCIFLPFVGFKDNGNFRYYPGREGAYWTSSFAVSRMITAEAIKLREYALCLKLKTGGHKSIGFEPRKMGCVIRPVKKEL